MESGSVKHEDRGYSAYAVLNVLLAHARWFLVIPLATGLLAAGLTLLLGRDWRAESTFAPQRESSSAGGALTGLASQLGVALPGLGESGESIDFYDRLAQSRVLLEDVVQAQYAFSTGVDGGEQMKGNLIELYGIEAESDVKRLHAATARLADDLEVAGDVNAGVVTVRTTAPWPGLAEQINRRLLDGIDRFNQERRQAEANAERTFLDERLLAARNELRTAEEELARFLEGNRQYERSPQLRFEAAQLERTVTNAQQLFTTIAQAYEQARLQEVRNTPVISVLDPPEGSARRKGSIVANAIWGAVAGAMLVILLAFASEYATRERNSNPGAYEEFEMRRRSLLRVNGGHRRKQAG